MVRLQDILKNSVFDTLNFSCQDSDQLHIESRSGLRRSQSAGDWIARKQFTVISKKSNSTVPGYVWNVIHIQNKKKRTYDTTLRYTRCNVKERWKTPSITTRCYRSRNSIRSQLGQEFAMRHRVKSFSKINLCKIRSISLPASRARPRSWNTLRSWVTHDLLRRKPCWRSYKESLMKKATWLKTKCSSTLETWESNETGL